LILDFNEIKLANPNHHAFKFNKRYSTYRDDEQVDLFRLLKTEYGIASAIYRGSTIQISPACN
jgi:hypothetical protein